MSGMPARQNRIILLASANADWLHRLAEIARTLPGPPVAVVGGTERQQVGLLAAASSVVLAVQIRDGGRALPEPFSGIPCGEQWLIQVDPLSDRELAFARGFGEVLPADVGNGELRVRLERVCRPDGPAMLVDGIEGLARVYAQELAGPIHYMGLGQRAMQQEIDTLAPLFSDLHKAWFESNQALQERLRMILSVINLKDSWENFRRTAADFADGILRLRDIQYLLNLSALMGAADAPRLTVGEMVAGCLRFLTESGGAGIRFTNRVPPGYADHFPAPFFFTGLLTLFSHVLMAMASQGTGRGAIEIKASSKRKPAGDKGHCLIITVRADNPEGGKWTPDFRAEETLFSRIGIRLVAEMRPAGFELVLHLPSGKEEA